MRVVLAALALLALPARADEPAACDADRVTTLYLGRDRPDRRRGVTDRDWAAFVRDEVAPRVGGWTELPARGGWRAPDGRLVAEHTRVLQIASHAGDGFDPRALAAAYARRFGQTSVLVVEQPACGVFVGP